MESLIDMEDDIVRRARNNRWLLRLTWLAISVLFAVNVDYIVECMK